MALKTLYLLTKCRLSFWFNIDNKYALAYRSLVKMHTYRLSNDDHKNVSILGRYIRLALICLFDKNNPPIKKGDSNFAVFNGEKKEVLRYEEYLSGITNDVPTLFLSRNMLSVNKGIGFYLGTLFGIAMLSLAYLPHAMFAKYSANYALIILEWVEWNCIAKILRNHKIDYLYFIHSYEKDSNFICLLLNQSGIATNRIPSENTLTVYFSEVISTAFSFTAPFQVEEHTRFKRWYVESTFEYPCLKYQELLKADTSIVPSSNNTIGFISSGVWRRIERGDQAIGDGEYESEEQLIEVLFKFLEAHKEYNLLIYLHPCEREDIAMYQKATDHYHSIFKNLQIEFLPYGMSSMEGFHLSNVAVSVYSSANMERLFLKMKTLYFPSCFSYAIYENTQLNKICARDEAQLINLLKKSMPMTNDEFFTFFGLERYPKFGLSSNH